MSVERQTIVFDDFLMAFAMGFASSMEGNNGEFMGADYPNRFNPTLETIMANKSFRDEAREAWAKMVAHDR